MRRRNGYILIAVAAGAIVLLGMLGMAVDLGRLYITKNEAQAFCDTAALAAATKLNGTSSGVTAAQNSVANSTNGWNMGTQLFSSSNYTVKFSNSANGPFVTNPPGNPTGYGFVEVTASPSLPLTFIQIVGAPTAQIVRARSVAGLVLATFPAGGYMPFTPFAHSTTDPNFGFRVGEEYAILWPSNINDNNKSKACHGDQSSWPTYNMSDKSGLNANDRGYFCVPTPGVSPPSCPTSSTTATGIGKEILGLQQGYPLQETTNLTSFVDGSTVILDNGQQSVEQNNLILRASHDTDTTNYQPTSAQGTGNWSNPANYHGNGQRLVIMPVSAPPPYTIASTNSPGANIIGFASFLLYTNYSNGGSAAWCAIYMGSSTVGNNAVSPYTGAGAYVARLLQ